MKVIRKEIVMGTKSVRAIQQALKAKGFDPGEVDGVWGRRTIAAVKHFQAHQGLTADGIVGPRTTAALFGDAAPAPLTDGLILPWFEEAKHLMGTKEGRGDLNNPEILDWAKDLDIKYPGDDVAWCGLFVGHCVGSTLPQEILPGNPLGARQWERFGEPTSPRVGAVMVFWRISKQSGKGHVGFYVGEDNDAYQILGGNQSDSVCLTWLSKSRFLGARWPRNAAKLTSDIAEKKRDEGLSSNEA
jgi:uncharacterized protein (TIGR02594 family)